MDASVLPAVEPEVGVLGDSAGETGALMALCVECLWSVLGVRCTRCFPMGVG